jgi:hypothetical protein
MRDRGPIAAWRDACRHHALLVLDFGDATGHSAPPRKRFAASA